MTNRIDVNYLAHVRPSARQLAWQKMEMYAFLHFGMNTFTNREWGLGHEDPHLFRLENLDVEEWMQALCAAGMTGVILTCKHHDGFCIWASDYTEYDVTLLSTALLLQIINTVMAISSKRYLKLRENTD